MSQSSYSFALASRLIAVELTFDGYVRPFVLIRNSAGAMVRSGPPVEALQLKENQEARFDVRVPFLPDTRNSGLVSHEFSNWGPREYQYTSVHFLGTTWPFGQQEFKTKDTSPESAHVERISYVFKQVKKEQDGTTRGVWVLTWSSEAGLTKLTGSVDVVADAGGGAAYVVLRLPGTCSGRIEFTSPTFGGERSFFADPGVAGAVAAMKATLDSGAAAERHTSFAGAADTALSAALAGVFGAYRQNLQAVHAAGIPDEFLDPVQAAGHEHAAKSALAVFDRLGAKPAAEG